MEKKQKLLLPQFFIVQYQDVSLTVKTTFSSSLHSSKCMADKVQTPTKAVRTIFSRRELTTRNFFGISTCSLVLTRGAGEGGGSQELAGFAQ